MISRLDRLPEEIKLVMLENFQINGALPITHSQIVSMMNDFKISIVDAIRSDTSIRADGTVNNSINNHIITNNNDNYATWTWGGKIHPVPDNFQFPRCNTLNLWNLWWRGYQCFSITGSESTYSIAPYRMINSWDLKCKNDSALLSKASFVISELTSCSGLTKNEIKNKNINELHAIFETAFVKLYKILHPDDVNLERLDKRRAGDKSYVTLYENLKNLYKPISSNSNNK